MWEWVSERMRILVGRVVFEGGGDDGGGDDVWRARLGEGEVVVLGVGEVERDRERLRVCEGIVRLWELVMDDEGVVKLWEIGMMVYERKGRLLYSLSVVIC